MGMRHACYNIKHSPGSPLSIKDAIRVIVGMPPTTLKAGYVI